jgi:uncharacterized protein (TIGR03067 family)
VAGLCLVWGPSATAADDPKELLKGVWVAQSMEVDGKPAPEDAVKGTRFTFKGDKLFVRENFADDSEAECACAIDPKQSPKQLDFAPPKGGAPVLGIYEVKGDELRVCFRQADSKEGRPTAFATKGGSKLVLIVFKRQKP